MDTYLLNRDYEKLFRWRYGMPPYEFWLNNKALITEMVKEFKLKPLDQTIFPDNLPAPIAGEIKEMRAKAKVIDKKLWPGGIRIPHVHLDRDIYLLDDKQWGRLVAAKVRDFKAKLSNVKTVNFEQMMRLSEGFDLLP